MAKKIHFYKQCTFEAPIEEGKKKDVAWIPENLAKVGKEIYFTDTPEELWTVTAAGTHRRSGPETLERAISARKFGPSLQK